MRTVSDEMRAAVEDATSFRMKVKAVVSPSRTFFNSLASDYPFDAGDYSVPTDTPVGQCAIYSGNMGKMYTFVVDSGTIYAMEQGDATKNNLSLTVDNDTKPAAYDLGNGSCYLWYWDGSNLKRVTVNLSTFGTSGSITVTIDYMPSAWTVSAGSPIALSATQLVFLYKTSIGGLAVGYYDGNRFYHWPGRFISANVLTLTDWSIYTAAAIHNGKIYVYSTDMDTGEVRGVEHNGYKDLWSDSFIALPADLSRFNVTNAIVSMGYIHLAGQFLRTDDLADAKVYSLLLRSTDGKTFSWDRFTLLSSLGFLFQVGLDSGGKTLYASDRNSVGTASASYLLVNAPIGEVTLEPPDDIVSFSSGSPESASLQVKGADESYYDHAVIKKGSRCKIFLGYATSAGDEYVLYETYIISSRRQGFTPESRMVILDLAHEGVWKVNQIAFPFYSEIISKSTQYDDCDDIDKMYPLSTEAEIYLTDLVVDFWNNDEWDGDGTATGEAWKFISGDGEGAAVRTFTPNSTTDLLFKTINLNENPLTTPNYPTIGSGTVTAKLYGWERTDHVDRNNSSWILYAVTAPADDLDDKTVTIGTLQSTYDRFERTYPYIWPPPRPPGSYPIEYSWAALTEDHVLLYIGIELQNTDSGGHNSQGVPERLEIEGVEFKYASASASSWWYLDNPDPDTYSRDFLRLPDTGLPSVQYFNKPYTAFKFNVSASFIHTEGSTPLSGGKVAWGVVGIGRDAPYNDYLVGRYRRQGSSLELVVVRSGVETLLASYSPGNEPKNIMMDHRDGVINVRSSTSTTWSQPTITHYWDEVTNGVISMSERGVMHVGIYAALQAPGFLTPGFKLADGDAIGMITGFPVSTLDGFPLTGEIVIDGQKYSYGEKVTSPSEVFGPYQGRNTNDYGSYTKGGVPYVGIASEIGLFLYPVNIYTQPAEDKVAGLIFAAQNGHTWWPITKSLWDVSHSTGGVPDPLPNRSRHYMDNAHGNYIGWNHRVYLCWGLGDIQQVSSGATLIHPFGSWVALASTEEIHLKRSMATTVDRDCTVKDMVRQLCRTASVETTFPGDWTSASQAVNVTPVEIAAAETVLPGGFDVYFTTPALGSGEYIALYGDDIFLDEAKTEKVVFQIKNNGGTFEIGSVPSGSTDPDYKQFSNIDATRAHDIRVLFHSEFCSVYVDDVWRATFAYDLIVWPTDQVTLMLSADSSHTVTDLCVVELFDWREAIYVESEMSAQSAIGSIIQERPIESGPEVNGSLSFSFNIVRDTITYTNAITKRILRSHQETDRTSGDAGSDAIVYYADVRFVENQDFADEEGFLTRVFKLSSLDTGADVAARILLEKAFEKQHIHSYTMRPDPRIEMGDQMVIPYLLPGTSTQISKTIIVETISLGMQEGRYEMTITGRTDV